MVDSKVARRYARSLIGLAQERNLTDKVYADMELVRSVCDANRDLVLMLNNPIVQTDKKNIVLKAIFAGKVDALTISFMDIITRKGREAYLPAIAIEYIQMYKFQNGVKTAFVKTATPMDTALRAEIMGLLKTSQGEKVELVEEVDKDLIGGFILRVGDKQHDASVSTKLRQLKNQFDDNLYNKEV